MPNHRSDPNLTPRDRDEACALGYGALLDLWIDGSDGFVCAALTALIVTEADWLREFDEEGPFDAVWEAEFFETLTELLPEDESLHEAALGTYSAVVALAVAGAIVVKSDNAGVIDDPPQAGEPQVLFFVSPERLARIQRAATAVGLVVRPAQGAAWFLAGPSLRLFPDFARRLSNPE